MCRCGSAIRRTMRADMVGRRDLWGTYVGLAGSAGEAHTAADGFSQGGCLGLPSWLGRGELPGNDCDAERISQTRYPCLGGCQPNWDADCPATNPVVQHSCSE
jgi:hypothetical protein